MTFLLDTDTCVYALKQHPRVLDRLLSEVPSDVVLSAIAEGELRTGAAKSTAPTRATDKLERFLEQFTILDVTSLDAIAYARVRAKLERAGTPIGPLDTWIAAQAVARGHTLVTNNVREYARVSSLTVENWTK